jgi:uncharacterized lipoprotein
MMRLVVCALALTLLAGCGIRSGLERPDPLWNSEEAIARECARAEAERASNPRARIDPRCEARQQAPQ